MVVFDDEMGVCVPYGLDPDCDGALGIDGPVAVFPDRKTARRAITISKKRDELEVAQGKPANTDFTESIKCVKIKDVEVVGSVALPAPAE